MSRSLSGGSIKVLAWRAIAQAGASGVAAAPQPRDGRRRRREVGVRRAGPGTRFAPARSRQLDLFLVSGGVAKHRQFAGWEEATIALGIWLAARPTGRRGGPATP